MRERESYESGSEKNKCFGDDSRIYIYIYKL